MPVLRIQRKPSNLHAQRRKPKNQNIKKVVRTNPVKNVIMITAGAVAHITLVDVGLQPHP